MQFVNRSVLEVLEPDLPKSSKSRHVAVSQSLANDLRSYIAQRPDAGDDAHVLTRCSGWTKGEHLPHTDGSLRNQPQTVETLRCFAAVWE